MSLVLSPADSSFLRKILTRNLVSMTPETNSSTDVNGNDTEMLNCETFLSPTQSLCLASSDAVIEPGGDSMSTGVNDGRLHPNNSPASSKLSSSSTPVSCSVIKNRASPILNLTKIDKTQILTPNRITHLCSPIEEEESIIKVIAATPENNVDCGTVEASYSASGFSTPSSKRNKDLASLYSIDSRNSFKSPVIRRSDITFGRFIGKGGFGTVHEGTIGEKSFAIKVVQKRRGSGIHREILQAERLAYRLNLRHKNIVAIFGVNMCDDLRGDALIVMELVTSRCLQELLDDTTRNLHRHERLRFAKEIASALHYLHSNEVAHLDVKPANVLMTSESVCKLSDFGSLTRTSPNIPREEVEYTQLLGTLPYRAPELMQGLFPSTKADLYSYGIILWQMLTREQPHKNENPHSLIYQVVKWNIRPNIPDPGTDETEKLYTGLYTACWDGDVNKRPSAGNVVDILNSLQQKQS